MTSKRILRLKDLIALLGISKSSIYLKIKEGSKYYDENFPKPFNLSARLIGWDADEINVYISFLKTSYNNRKVKEGDAS